MPCNLQGLRPGQYGRLTDLSACGAMRERLTDLGFISGSEVCCLYAAAFGDPRAYRIRGAVIALRREDARCIGCEPLGGAL